MEINRMVFRILLIGFLLQTSLLSAQVMPVPDDPAGSVPFKKSVRRSPPYLKLQDWQSLSRQKTPVSGVWKSLVILMDFPDYTWDTQADSNFVNPVNDAIFTGLHSPDYFRSMLFSSERFRDPFSQGEFTGSMRDFYRENSYGLFEIDGVVTRWYRADSSYRYYCNTDGAAGTDDDFGFSGGIHSVRSFVQEAVTKADVDVDFSQFDNDQDGVVDALFIIHAGLGAEELYTTNYPVHFNYFWSHQSAVNYQIRDGVVIQTYTLEPENGTIGVFCHEFGHALGLPDLYDLDSSSEGIGEWCLMGGGGWCYSAGDRIGSRPAHFSTWAKNRLGWLQPIVIQKDTTNLRLPPVEQLPVAIRLDSPQMSANSENPEEYFLLENRQNILFDSGLTRRQVSLGKPPATGLLIYHINERVFGNSDESNKQVDLEEATPYFRDGDWYENLDHERNLLTYQYLDQGNRGDNGDPYPGYFNFSADLTDYIGERTKDEFADLTHPNSRAVNGTPTLITVKNIRIDGQDILVDIFFGEPTLVADYSETTRPPKNPELTIYPNPVQNDTRIHIDWHSPVGEQVGKIAIFNLLGEQVREITVLRNGTTEQTIYWDTYDRHGRKLQNGIYFVTCQARNFRTTRKILITR